MFGKLGLRLKPSKCHFAAEEVQFLGHVVSKDGVSLDQRKIELVKNFPTLESQHDVGSFLGLANYYRRFVKNVSATDCGTLERSAQDRPKVHVDTSC